MNEDVYENLTLTSKITIEEIGDKYKISFWGVNNKSKLNKRKNLKCHSYIMDSLQNCLSKIDDKFLDLLAEANNINYIKRKGLGLRFVLNVQTPGYEKEFFLKEYR